MSDTIYDRFHPAPGVKVAPFIKSRVHDLNKSQAAGEWHVFRRHGPVGLGMHSVSDASRNAVRKGDNATCPDKYNVPVSTHGPGVRPMSKIRKAKPAKQNTVFHSDRAGKLENADRKAVRDLKRLKSLKGTLQYSVLRTELLARHPSLLKHIAGFELSSRNW